MKKLSFVLALAMCFSIFAAPVANAQAASSEKIQEEAVVYVPVVDTEGNLLATVPMSAESVRALSIAAAAAIFVEGVKSLVYSGAAWVCMNPQLTQDMIMLLPSLFETMQSYLGEQVKTGYYEKGKFTSCVTVSGQSCYRVSTTQWACAYSV